MPKSIKVNLLVCVIILASPIVMLESFGQMEESHLFDKANEYFSKGNFEHAIDTYDKILEKFPTNIPTLKMKGIAQSNLENHEESLKQFFRVIQYKPDDAIALTGMGVGFGNLGEYQEAMHYFEKAEKIKPNSKVIKNYKDFLEKTTAKYPHIPTEKPQGNSYFVVFPQWFKIVAMWWSDGMIKDSEFVDTLEFLIKTKQIQVPIGIGEKTLHQIPPHIKEDAGLWSRGLIQDKEFANDIKVLFENQILNIPISKLEEDQKAQQDLILFEKYLKNISKKIIDEKRYIENLNPSKDVIKKFLRDYNRWNFESEVSNEYTNFPDPVFEVKNETYLIHYKVFVNEQPSGLPLDHKNTLNSSLNYWENQELTINDKKAKVDFEIVKNKQEANVWITWVVRDLGEGVLGHAHLGKGIVEVTLGDYNCDGSFQLYDITSVEKIMTHELGHSIGLQHSSDPDNVMFSSISPDYSYCLLS